MNKLAGVFPSPITTVQEDGATSSTDVAEPATNSTEVDKTSKESVSVELGQLLRAAEPDQCVLKVKTTATERYCRVHTLTAECEWKSR